MAERTADELRIYLLGEFRVMIGQRAISAKEWRLRKARSLFQLLALAPYHRLHREYILDLFWQDFEPEAALNNLHQAMHVLRHILEPALKPLQPSTYISFQEEMVTLSPARLWIDVEQFETLRESIDGQQQPAIYQEALALYRGELLPEDRYEDWVIPRRDQLRRTYMRLLDNLAQIQLARNEKTAAIETLQKLVIEEPTLEEAHTQLIQLYNQTGQRYSALRQYQQLREALRRYCDTEPSHVVQLLYQDMQTGHFPPDPDHMPAHASARNRASYPLAERQDNLPAALNGFIGREQEIKKIGKLLTQTRLITLTGAGGSGKTRLALQTARTFTENFADGVYLVELAALTDPLLVQQTVASALQVYETADAPLVSVLVETLRRKHMLLLLDNCEHLVEACAQLVQHLLQSCPQLHILATSRQALGILGETVWHIPGLTVPDLERLPPFEQLLDYDAVRLFTERASACRANFALTVENAPAVLQICHKLDGMPLAIELAAVRVNVLAVEQILTRLDDALALLVTGNRMAQRRQQTLRATYEWSYALLSEPERALFRRLAVFVGGWTLEAAETVCMEAGFQGSPAQADTPLPVFELLTLLVEKSLVVVSESSIPGEGTRVRYTLLETLRQYGTARLEAAGETDAARNHHLQWYLTLAETAEDELRGTHQDLWLARLEVEHDNLRTALNWANQSGAKVDELRLAGALWLFCSLRSYLSEGRRALAVALENSTPPEQGSEPLVAARAKALRGASVLAYEQSDFERAVLLAEESMACYRRLNDLNGHAGVLNNLGILAMQQGDYARAETLCRECLELARKIGYEPLIATVLNNLGVISGEQNDLIQAALFYEESLAQYRQLGDKDGISRAFLNLGEIALKQASSLEAAGLYRESLILAQGLGNKGSIAYGLEGFAASVASLEAHTSPSRQELLLFAAKLWGAAQTLRGEMNAPLTSSDLALYEQQVNAARGRGDTAAFARAWSEGQVLPYDQALAAALAVDLSIFPATKMAQAPSLPDPVTTVPLASHLTQREREVALLIAEGDSNRVIATKLALSERTAEHHVARILAKLQLTSRAQIAVWVIKQHTPPI